MTRRYLGVVVILAAATGVACGTPTTGQAPAGEIPRAADGRPDLSGIWQALGTAHWDLQDHAAAPSPFPELLGAIGAVPAGVGVVDGGEIPYQEWAAEQKRTNYEQRMSADPFELTLGDPEVKCYMPGVPRATYLPFPFQIFQSASEIAVVYEFANASRVINLETHEDAPIESWMGWSNGRWEDDTLVVDVTGFNGRTWFDRAGNFHSDALRVVERYTPRGLNHLDYEATIEDSNVFTRPWTIRMPLYRRLDANARVLEFRCIEFAEPLMYGSLNRPSTE